MRPTFSTRRPGAALLCRLGNHSPVVDFVSDSVPAWFARQPADSIRPERITRDHPDFGMIALQALERATLEAFGAG